MKRWIFILLGALAMAVLIAYVVGRKLPRDHMAMVRTHYRQPADSIYNAIADVAAYPKWRTDVKRVTLLPAQNGRVVWREFYRRDSLDFQVTAASPPMRMTATIISQNTGFSGRWSYQIISDSTGTMVTIVEEGSVDNPFFRFMMRYIFGMHSSLERFERALGTRFGETVQTTRIS